MTQSSAQITIARTLPSDIGMRDVFVSLDGQTIATLRNQQSITSEVTPGHHTLRVHNTLVSKAIEFDARPGEHIRFTTSNRSGCATSLIFFLGAGPIYISLEREDQPAASSPPR